VLFFGTHSEFVSDNAQQTGSPVGVSHAYKNHSFLDTNVVLRRIRNGPEAWTGILAQGEL
jgi:hypothetical protein